MDSEIRRFLYTPSFQPLVFQLHVMDSCDPARPAPFNAPRK